MEDYRTRLLGKKSFKKSTIKDHLKELWVNARSLVYAGLTLGGILLVVLGSVLLLPIVLIIVVGAIAFFAYRLSIYDNEDT